MISDELWEHLNKLKKRGESFQDVLERELKFKPVKKEANKK